MTLGSLTLIALSAGLSKGLAGPLCEHRKSRRLRVLARRAEAARWAEQGYDVLPAERINAPTGPVILPTEWNRLLADLRGDMAVRADDLARTPLGG